MKLQWEHKPQTAGTKPQADLMSYSDLKQVHLPAGLGAPSQILHLVLAAWKQNSNRLLGDDDPSAGIFNINLQTARQTFILNHLKANPYWNDIY